MNKLITGFSAALLLSSNLFLPIAGKVSAAGPNLIANPSVETAGTSTNPANWTANKWGTNTTSMAYQNGGHSGNKSLYINMSSRSSGDAKWMHDAVNVTPNTSYTFTDYYQSNVATELDIQYTDTSGNVSYAYIKTLPSASTWAQSTSTFTTPANASKAVILHIIYSPGWLQTDDYELRDNTTAPTNNPPSVSFSSPSNGSTVAGTVNISANASDDQAVAGVQFKIDGVNIGNEDTTAPYSVSWNSTSVSNGNHTLTAVARDNTGLTATATSIVNVQNAPSPPTSPTVSLTTPAPGSTVSSAVNVAASASDAQGISNVQFKLDGNNLGNPDTTAPYSVNWDTTSTQNGNHILTATATNTSGLSTTSAQVSVNVQNQVTPPPPAETNLIPNASMETAASSTAPQSWTSNKWGTNTASFSYLTSGHSGSRSVRSTVTSYSSGDAKWYFTPLNVQANTQYTFSDWYQSNVSTDVVVQYTSASGANTYQWLGTLPASSAWAQSNYSFTTPSNVSKLSVFHVIASVGQLTIDDASLTTGAVEPPPPPPPPGGTGFIPNASVETAASSTAPANWLNNTWGSNTANFQYLNEGHTGNRSVKVTVSNYSSGDAKWYFEPITTLEKGKQYRFSTWYKTNTTPHVVAMFIANNGTEKYFGMPNPQPNGTSDWQFYTDTFTVPIDAQAVSVFMFVSNNGWVQVDDQSITTYQPVGFNRGLVTLTFDDGHEDNINTALPMMNSYGFKSTQCYATDHLEGQNQNIQNAMAFFNSGHEICSHTVSHPFLTQVSQSNLTYELQHSQQFLQGMIGQSVLNFASPYGDYNVAVNDKIRQYYRSHRTVDEGYNSKDNFDIYRLRVQNMQSDTTLAEVQSWLAKAAQDKTWLILVYHRVANNPGQFDTYTSEFAKHLQAIQASGLTVKTYNAALDEVTAQL